MAKKHPLLVLVMILLAAALACTLPTAATPAQPANEAEATITALARTVEAILAHTPTAPPASEQPTTTFTAEPPTPTPTNTQPPPTLTPVPPTPIPCDQARFIADISVPDGAQFTPGQTFTKTWRLENSGSCTWTTGYAVVFESGNAMDAPATVNLTSSVAPGQRVDISIAMKAPSTLGKHKGNWKIRNASGARFGLGAANISFFVDIEVVEAPAAFYSFVSKVCEADWRSAAGDLPCPGSNVDNRGFVLTLTNPKMENGDTISAPAIETHPMWDSHPLWGGNGWIQGTYPDAIPIVPGHKFKGRVGCLFNAATCKVNFFIKYKAGSDPWTTLGPPRWYEDYDGSLQSLDVDLSFLAGQSVKFMLQVDANSNAGQDWAVWINPRIEK
ncbi:MAG: NBR1-Ig-like domain-containing protein [Anaerolineaceae bacterium]|nr:NBR1-Ig-like domain-containing protein [Anaerolineaceae bacterium]